MQPMTVLLAVLMLTVAHSAKVKIKDNGQCSIHHNGCMYQLVLRDANCMQGDSPANPNDLEHLLSGPDNDIILETPVDKATKKAAVEEMREEKQEMKKLDELERKLTKMMEGLSVRSLRHIRQIRNDLRQMTSTMDLIKQQSGSRKSKRGLPCPPEFVRVGTWQSCYRFSNFNTTWHEAREYCSAFGADLVSLDTLKESYILDYLIKSSPEVQLAKGWWTSGNFITRSERWMWTSRYHLMAMKLDRWAEGEPDAPGTHHCLMLYRFANYMWHDADCSDRHNFICEVNI